MALLKTILVELWYILLIVILAYIICELVIAFYKEIYHAITYRRSKKRIQNLLDIIDKNAEKKEK